MSWITDKTSLRSNLPYNSSWQSLSVSALHGNALDKEQGWKTGLLLMYDLQKHLYFKQQGEKKVKSQGLFFFEGQIVSQERFVKWLNNVKY